MDVGEWTADRPRRNDTLREQLVELIRSSVLRGSILPGDRLVEAQLSEQLGVSRGPIREAIRQLVDEGLVENVPYRGTVVRTLTVEDIEEIFSFRILLESYAFRRVWPLRDRGFSTALVDRHEALQQAIRSGNRQDAIIREMDLHGLAYERAEHALLLESWTMLRARLHMYFTFHHMAHDRTGSRLDAHDRYVALAGGDDLDAMIDEIDTHMRRGLDRLRAFVRARREDAGGVNLDRLAK